jgi:23S rRNA pseudouridine955/2504/2580 synthase
LLLVAKTYTALQHLQNLWRAGKVTKVYLTWVWGLAKWPEWSHLSDQLPKGKNENMHQVQAESWVRTLRQNSRASLLAVRLITGRKHQIRIQLARRGYPVIGDRKYGPGKSGGQGLLLHAAMLGWEERFFQLSPPWGKPYAVSEEEMALAVTSRPQSGE